MEILESFIFKIAIKMFSMVNFAIFSGEKLYPEIPGGGSRLFRFSPETETESEQDNNENRKNVQAPKKTREIKIFYFQAENGHTMTKTASWMMEKTQILTILILNTKILGVGRKRHLQLQAGVEAEAGDVDPKM